MPTSPQRLLTVGAGAFQNLRAFVGRGAKLSAPVTAICGAIADLASTIGRFSLYLFILALGTAVISGSLWFVRYRRRFAALAVDGKLDSAELAELSERNVWSMLFAFSVVASIVMGGFVIAGKLAGEEKGVLAAVVPGMDQVQEALFRVEKKLDDVKADTAAIREETSATRQDTARIATSIEEIARRFDSLAATGGIVPGAKTPEEHYHNARIHELGGNFAAARKEYTEFLAANLEFLDPWQSYANMLKMQEGRADAVATLRYFGDKLRPPTVSYETTLALLEEASSRVLKLQALALQHPEYGPLAWLLSQEFSEARRGDQTLADQRQEKEWLERFREAQAAGQVNRYFLDKKEAQTITAAADARWAKLTSTPARVLDNPVTMTAQQSGSGWAAVFSLSDFKAKELFYQLDGRGEFQSTGHLPYVNPQTGLPMINLNAPLPNLSPGEHTLLVKYTDKNEQTNGPYTLKFSTGDHQLAQGKMMLNASQGSWLSFRDFNGQVLLYFSTLMSYRPLLKEVRYSINSEALDKTFKFKPSDKMFEVGDEVYLNVAKNAQFAAVQVTYKDGTKSSIQKVMRVK